jgi:hypothetical protein
MRAVRPSNSVLDSIDLVTRPALDSQIERIGSVRGIPGVGQCKNCRSGSGVTHVNDHLKRSCAGAIWEAGEDGEDFLDRDPGRDFDPVQVSHYALHD